MKLDFSINKWKLTDLFNAFASDENLSKHLESFNIENANDCLKMYTYKATISTSDPTFLKKIIDALKEEEAEQITDEGQ